MAVEAPTWLSWMMKCMHVVNLWLVVEAWRGAMQGQQVGQGEEEGEAQGVMQAPAEAQVGQRSSYAK